MKQVILLIAILMPLIISAQGWIWQSQIQGETYLKVISTETHSDGRSFVLLEYSGTINVSGNSVTSAGGNDIAIVSFSDSGNFLWMESIGSNDAEIAASMAIDEANGYLYINGDFKNTCWFGASVSLTSDGLFDAFLAKYSLNGTLINAKRVAWGINSQRSVSLCIENGNVVATGLFLDEASFEGGNNFTGNGITSNYIVKYNSSGTIQWVKKTLGKYTVNWFRDIKPYSGGYIIAGQFRDTLFLDVETIVSQTTNLDMFIYAIDNNGNGQWVRTIKGGLGDDQFNKLSVSGDIYLSGITKSDTLNMQTGATTFQQAGIGNTGNFDIIMFSYTTGGNYKWHKKYGSVNDDRSMFIDANSGHFAIGGYYSGAITIETETPVYNAGTEGFHALYSSEGIMEDLSSFNGSGSDYIRAVKFFADGNQVVAGEYNSDVLSFGTSSLTNPSPGNYAGFIAKYGCFNVVNISSTQVSCLDGFGNPIVADGTATANPSGGRTPYTYAWSNGQNTQTATDLDLATYTVTVTDANNCTVVSSVTITAVPSVSLSVSGFTNNTCLPNNNGTITVSPINGKAPYTYLWNTVPAQTSATATGLTAGTYTCTVTDGCSNMATASQTIILQSNLSVSLTVTNVTCYGLNNGSISSSVSGNGSPFTYNWSNGLTTSSISGLAPGTYTVTVTNICNSTATASAAVTQPTVIVVDYQVYCTDRNKCNGYAQALPTGGTPGYTYQWSNYHTTQTITGLCKGAYSVTVTDANGCTKEKSNIRIKDCNPQTSPYDTSASKVAEEDDILIFPNPADHDVNVSSKNKARIAFVEIYDITGKLCFKIDEAKMPENNAKIDVSEWPKGLYMIVVNTGEGIIGKHLIIE